MDPYAKAFKISATLHAGVIIFLCLFIAWNELFKPRAAAVFTVMAPPAGMIAGGPMTNPQAAPSEVSPAPTGPKLPSPPASEKPPQKITTTLTAPQDDFLDAAPPQPKTVKKTDNGIVKPRAARKVEKLSYAEFQKKYAAKIAATQKARSKAMATATAVPASTPSFEENLASRLDKKLQEQGDATVGTGLGGAPGSGIAGSGVAGASDDPDAIYSGTIYTYLNSVWEEPKEVGNVHLFAKVEFNVSKTGAITAWAITRKSGVDAFDRSVAKVFARVKQLSAPPTPQEYRLTVTFETRDS
jgi:TonB family protein